MKLFFYIFPIKPTAFATYCETWKTNPPTETLICTTLVPSQILAFAAYYYEYNAWSWWLKTNIIQNFLPTLNMFNFAFIRFCKCQESIQYLNFALIKFQERES